MRPELGKALRSYPLRHGRERAAQGSTAVHRPRRRLLYRMPAPGLIDIVRVLHDAIEV